MRDDVLIDKVKFFLRFSGCEWHGFHLFCEVLSFNDDGMMVLRGTHIDEANEIKSPL